METKNVKIVHILNGNDIFLSWVKKTFNHSGISNQFIVLNPKGSNTINENGDLHCNLSSKGKALTLEAINKSDVTIHYFLDYVKSELILKSDKQVRHFWYFFGADVYQQLNVFRKNLYGHQTKKWMLFSLSYKFRLEFRAMKHLVFKQSRSPKQNLIKSLDRIEKLLWYIEDEIIWINRQFKTPEFEYFKFFSFNDVFPFETSQLISEKNNILIGNSAAIENNHLDVLEVFKKEKLNQFNVSLPLSYGKPEKYRNKVKKEYFLFFGDKFHSQEVSLAIDDYYNWLNKFPTAIMLHYRQQALGNIFYLMANGTKLYFSKRNILYEWFINNKLKVFCFEEDFVNDCQSDNLTLSTAIREQNYLTLRSLLEKESLLIPNLINLYK